jgi:hypothetical protein
MWIVLSPDMRCGLEHKSGRRAKVVAPLATAQIRRIAHDCGVTATRAQEPISVFSSPHDFRAIWALDEFGHSSHLASALSLGCRRRVVCDPRHSYCATGSLVKPALADRC